MGPLPDDIQLFERGWLSSNNILLLDDESGDAILIDTGYGSHADQTLALVEQALKGRRLRSIVNTHLHSDHCGGNALLSARHHAPIYVPCADYPAARDWDPQRLSFQVTGQRCERFLPHGALKPGDTLCHGRRRWEVIAAPGHDPHALMFFDAQDGLLISADALWENGFGVVFPELVGEPGFDDVRATLGLIRRLDARRVLPGHGAIFDDVDAAIDRALAKLAAFEADPIRHAWHAAKVLVKFHLLEVRRQTWPDLLAWLDATPYLRLLHQRYFSEQAWSAWQVSVVEALCTSGALRRDGQTIVDV
ncbi:MULTISPECIES: MBL fold metallo-hydrolase [Caldimonas]|uniref:MBL fold metallo-hydrolase n=1 Tax=Caldimonas TaxID=196013 RepID=UPI0003660A70|nr:MBL fold metallo-hydrolase [Caldimonas manganoxidans]